MERAHLRNILIEIVRATEREGWFEAPEGKTLTLYASRHGASLNASKINAVRFDPELVHARTTRGETYVLYWDDIFAAVVEGTAEASKRKAGFV
ncbi:MAG: hypothetical protein RMJ98_13130 [Myxococcales bacterium]|nr:hypothetical protein [Polyangiaceae bacterium]MDW8250231.1 hypothetical protein [Myxococcales bacterium]